jgi:hypothetical protein
MRVLALVAAVMMTACSNEYDLCLEREKQEYRQRNPGASYGQVQSRQADFEMMCSSLRSK